MADFNWNGLLNFEGLDDPVKMGLLQTGAAILAANTGRVPAGAAFGQGMFAGAQNMSQLMAQKQRLDALKSEDDRRTQEFEWQKQIYNEARQQKQQQEAAWQRLFNPNSYVKTEETQTQRPVYAPIPAANGAQAPNYGLSREMVTDTQKNSVFDNAARMRDMWAIPSLREKIVAKEFQQPDIAFAPDGTVIDKNDASNIGKNFRADRLDVNKPFMLVDGKVVPNEAYQSYEMNKAASGASKTNITNSPVFKQEGKEAEEVGKFFGEQYAKIQQSGFSADSKINKLGRLNQLLEGVNTGKLAPIGVEVASTAQSMGINIDPKLGNKQAAEALANEMALELRNPSGGAGMPGAMSNEDRAFLKQMVPGIEKTPEGRKLISDTAMALAKRDKEVAKLAREYRKKNGSINEGFYEELNKFAEQNPLFKQATANGWSVTEKR